MCSCEGIAYLSPLSAPRTGHHRREAFALERTVRHLVVNDAEVARLLSDIDLRGREVLRRAMRAERWERDEFAVALLRRGTDLGKDLADLLDLASLHPQTRQQLVRVLGQLEAEHLMRP
jgi:hypothetical protein